MIIKRTYGLLYLIVFNWGLNAQHYPHAHQQYSFIDISKNRLEVFNDEKWQNFIGEIHHQWQLDLIIEYCINDVEATKEIFNSI